MKVMHKSMIVVSVLFLSFLFAINAIAKTAAEVFEKVSQSVVVVQAQDKNGKTISFNSGVVLPNGDVATNCHLIKKAFGIKVYQGKKGYSASSRYTDWDRDVCSLSVPSIKAVPVSVGNTKKLKVGSRVYAVGALKGLTLTFSEGTISSMRSVDGGQYLQITAPISPSSSGGGLFDEEGKLIGLTTFYIAEVQQLNFAVPVEWIRDLSKRHNKTLKTADTYTDWFMRSVVLEEKEDWEGLINHAQQRINVMPKDALAWYSLGRAYGETDLTAKAIKAFQQAARINPEDDASWYNLGTAYGQSGMTAKAIKAFQQAVRINPAGAEGAASWHNLGTAYGKLGMTAKSIEAFQQSVRINPENFNAWYHLGTAYGKLGMTTKAIKALQQAIRINPEDAGVWDHLGIEYAKSGLTAKAIEAFRQVVRINPEDADAWYGLGLVYEKSGLHTKAIEAFQQNLRINPEEADAWYWLGVSYALAGQKGQALEVYKRLKTINPAKADKYFKEVILP